MPHHHHQSFWDSPEALVDQTDYIGEVPDKNQKGQSRKMMLCVMLCPARMRKHAFYQRYSGSLGRLLAHAAPGS